ncbi:hypothetical protein A1E_05595 [Rickettsia canadensis str. McKiel]|uniref:Uncharacterized protein n=1 Tax=Rickettsia canadensis (strain McKiel) TaxID=293613 RepID=A8F097_RICCK|nr:hypothetical protein A1E_05595 [Rickettsia canadensis str. McKiel]
MIAKEDNKAGVLIILVIKHG